MGPPAVAGAAIAIAARKTTDLLIKYPLFILTNAEEYQRHSVKASEVTTVQQRLDSWAAMAEGHMTAIVVCLFVFFAAVELFGRGFGSPPNTSLGRMSTNFGLVVISAVVALVVPLSSMAGALLASANGWGLFNVWLAPWWIVIVVALVARTLAGYWIHRAMHAVPWLWRIHRVHHSDTHFDLTLSLRSHPFDALLRMMVFAGVSLALGLPIWAVLLVEVALTAANFWEHVDATLPPMMQRALGTVLVTPAAHRLHHSAWQPQTDSNFGAGLIVWDRLFGTYRSPQAEQAERIGLGDAHDHAASNLWQQLLLPFADADADAEESRAVSRSPE